MTTTTQTGQITLPAAELRAILAALDEYTTSDKTKHVLTLARVTPLIIEQTDADETRPTGLVWEATDSFALVSITHRAEHTLTGSALIDPAAILAALPKKAAGKTTLTLTTDTWQLETTAGALTMSGGKHLSDVTWPNTAQLWQDQQPNLAPHTLGAFQLARLAKTAKHLGTEQVNAETMAHTDGKPDPRRPIVYTITAGTIEARALLMPARRH